MYIAYKTSPMPLETAKLELQMAKSDLKMDLQPNFPNASCVSMCAGACVCASRVCVPYVFECAPACVCLFV